MFIVLSGIAMGASWIFLYEAYQRIGVGLSSLAYYTGQVIVTMLSSLVFKERFTARKLIGFLASAVFVAFKTGFQLQSDPDGIGWLVFLGLVNTGICCYLYFSSIGRLPVQTVAILGYLEPLSAVVFVVLILGRRCCRSKF